MSDRYEFPTDGLHKKSDRFPRFRVCAVLLPLVLAACPTPTKTDVSIQAAMPLALGERIVLFPSIGRDNMDFANCLQGELFQQGVPRTAVMDTMDFQDAMFPWFEHIHAPKTAQEMESLLLRPIVRDRITALNVRYLIDFTIGTEADGFPGMFCGGGGYPGGVGCLGVFWADKNSELSAVVWDLKKGSEAGDVSVFSSGRSFGLGVVIPIVFNAYTQKNACEALASELAKIINSDARN